MRFESELEIIPNFPLLGGVIDLAANAVRFVVHFFLFPHFVPENPKLISNKKKYSFGPEKSRRNVFSVTCALTHAQYGWKKEG